MKLKFPLSALLLLLAAAPARALTIAVYHTNDAHGWYSARPARWDNHNPNRLIGGYAALSALLKKEKNPYLLFDSGDLYQGTPEGILTKGMASITLMNQLGYSAAVPGNHDFDYGEARFKTLVSSAAFPFVGANVYNKKDFSRAAYLKPFVILEKAGKKIAVPGLLGKHTATSTLPANVKNLEFREEAAETARWMPEVLKRAPDAVIVLAHIGLSMDLSLKLVDVSTYEFDPPPFGTLLVARAAHGINLVLGGHNHSGLARGFRDPISGAWLGESYYGLSYVTRAELIFDDATGKLDTIRMELLPLWVDETGQDPAVLKTLAGFEASVERAMGKVVGRAAADLALSPAGLDSPLGNWLCDVTRKAAGTDMAFHNTGALRFPIRKGPVRLRDLYQAMPFENTVITMRLSGVQLAQLMSDNLGKNKAAMQVSGLEVEFKPGPHGVPSVLRLRHKGKEIKPADEFTVATNSYLAFGGDGGNAFADGKDVTDTLLSVRDIMAKAISKTPIKPPKTGRIKRLK